MGNAQDRKGWIIKSIVLLLVYFLVNIIYIYVSEIRLTEPHFLFTPIDWAIPLYPPAVVIYICVFYSFVFFALLYYATFQRAYFNQLIFSLIAIHLIAYAIYIVYPVMMIRPYWMPTSLFDWIFWSYVNPKYIYTWMLVNSIQLNSGPFNWALWLVYANDTPLNCFPSLHAAISTMIAFAFWQEKRSYGWASWPIAIAVMISTLLVRQHVIVDEIAGALLALLVGYLFYKKVFRSPETQPQKPKLWQVIFILVVAEIVLILYLYGVYMP
ncbi:MAG: phosphatase PAP2 family protein [Candidatus Jordarchaeum sp.]|uniref:phosphatase PAP2 family protein n=1 Tax=Candidatus Jordarchaeum sp. TaxID=2823881 RepID=UPI0040495349